MSTSELTTSLASVRCIRAVLAGFSPDSLEFIRPSLAAPDFVLQVSGTWEQTVQMLDCDPCDLLLTDIELSGIAVAELVNRLHSRWPDLPIVIITARGSEGLAAEVIKAGACDYIVLDRRRIARLPLRVREALGQHRAARDQARAAQELALSRSRLDLAMAAGHMGTFDHDLLTDRVVWGGEHAQLWGMAPHEFDGKYSTAIARVHPDDVPAIEAAVVRSRENRTILELEFRVIWPDRSVHWIAIRGQHEYDEHGRAIRILGIAIDHTARHIAEDYARRQQATIEDSRSRLEMAMAAGHMGTYDWDLRADHIVWSGEHAAMWGMTPQAFDGHFETVLRSVHPEDLPALRAIVDHCIANRTIFDHEFRVVWTDGSIHWIISRGQFTYDKQGRPIRMLGIVIDNTPRRKAEETARQQQAQIAHLLRLNLLSQIAAGLAHEINQPLSAIANYAGAAMQLCRKQNAGSCAVGEICGEIEQQAQRAGQIVHRLRDFIRRSPPEFAPCDLNAVASEALALMSYELGRNRVRAAFEPAANLRPARADRVQIQQVLVNLIQNAIEAMEQTPLNDRVLRIATVETPSGLIVRVFDRGTGIAPGDLRRIFESFHSTKPGGLGMGLPISRTIVESHGGSLSARNDPGGGAVFEFILPVEGESAS